MERKPVMWTKPDLPGPVGEPAGEPGGDPAGARLGGLGGVELLLCGEEPVLDQDFDGVGR
ncbi:hypothetical protein NicSoilB8_12420 [Arthrobacter sp. NicSoilB8]|nr:hypothetical protein NicSoilB8_12420 [Arthrobacter sp. NicSoilB8]